MKTESQNRPQSISTVEAMLTYGGSFARALGKAYQLADSINAKKIESAFPELFEYYAGIALRHNESF